MNVGTQTQKRSRLDQHIQGTTRAKRGIATNPEILMGKPCIAGHRIAVEQILEDVERGCNVLDIAHLYRITKQEVLAAIEYARTAVHDDWKNSDETPL